MERVRYEKPSRINAVSILLFLALLAGAYALILFGPPYYRRYKASGILSESVNKIYPRRMATGTQEMELFSELTKETEQKLRDLGIKSEFKIQFRKDRSEIGGTLEYIETVQHWFVGKTTTLRFTVDQSMSATSSLQ